MTFDNKAMAAALAADGDKLAQLTGQDHGPSWFVSCAVCGQFWFSSAPPDCDHACPDCGCPLEPDTDD